MTLFPPADIFDPSAAQVEYPFEQLEVDLGGKRWQATGSAILVEDVPFASYGCSAFQSLIEIEQVDRLDDQGNLEYEDFPYNLFTAQEQLMLNAAISIKLNSQPDKLNQFFAERMEEQ